MSKRLTQIEQFRQNPEITQLNEFNRLISKGEKTAFGVDHDFKSINKNGIHEFQSRVKLSNYEDLKPYIQRVQNGEKNVMWPGSINWFAVSSGTTDAKSKYIPISKESIDDCHIQAVKDSLAIYFDNNPKSKLFSGKGLIIGGSKQTHQCDNGIYYGDLSAVLMNNGPEWSHFFRTPDLSVALMPEWEEKLSKMAKITANENVTNMSGVPSWTLVLIKKILKDKGVSDLKEVWPNLELFLHGGVNFEPYVNQYQKLIPSGINYMETYNASEGFFAMQDDPNSKDMLLMMDYGIFYEFVPLDQIDQENPKAYTVDDVELDKTYALVITTNTGLWRYIIGDTVKFTSLTPHKMIITGRVKHFINAFGEELMVNNTDKAIKKACIETGAEVAEYTVAPVYMSDQDKGKHEWIIEFGKEPKNFELFCTVLDDELKEVNSDYAAKRYKNLSLDFPIIRKAASGSFHKWLKDKDKLGGQHKIPRLSNNRDFISEIKNYI